MEEDERKQRNVLVLIALLTGSLFLVAGSLYMLKELAYLYGVGIGATTAAQQLGVNITASSSAAALISDITILHGGLYESYALTLIALVAMGSALILFVRRYEKNQSSQSTYSLLHTAFTVVYLLLLFVIVTNLSGSFKLPYLYIAYLGIIFCLGADAYMQYDLRQMAFFNRSQRGRNSVTMDPSKPFSNLIVLKEIFGNMSGELRIVDKHFSSSALENLYRISEKSRTNFTKLAILTSKEQMDSGFGAAIIDFRKELNVHGIGLEVRMMDEKDAVDQHERFMMDDKVAYKIPPFNIINKRSEHITKINFAESDRRFKYLYGRAISIENYSIKKARDPQSA
jgi:hypothetical protein